MVTDLLRVQGRHDFFKAQVTCAHCVSIILEQFRLCLAAASLVSLCPLAGTSTDRTSPGSWRRSRLTDQDFFTIPWRARMPHMRALLFYVLSAAPRPARAIVSGQKMSRPPLKARPVPPSAVSAHRILRCTGSLSPPRWHSSWASANMAGPFPVQSIT